jgi:hypothetical protein
MIAMVELLRYATYSVPASSHGGAAEGIYSVPVSSHGDY